MNNYIIPQDPDELAFLEAQSHSGHIASDDPFTAYDICVTRAMPYGNCASPDGNCDAPDGNYASPDVNMMTQSDTDVKSDVTLTPHAEYQDFVTPHTIETLLSQSKNVIMKAETGHGKTTAIESAKQRTVLAMPMQAQCKQRQAKGSSFAVYEGVSIKDIPLDWGNVATTYNSLPRVMAACTPDLLAIDEIHHFLTDAYRQSAIRDAYRAVRAFDGPEILMSATPLADILTNTIFPEFKAATCLDIGTKRIARDVPIIAMDGGMIDHASQIARTGMINGSPFPKDGVIICHVNDKTVIHASIDHINKVMDHGKAYGFTAGTKEDAHHEMMIKDGNLPADCRFLFVTSLINDGFSFGPRANVVLVSRQSSLLPHECGQLCARWRDGLDMAMPHALIIFKREPDKKPMDLGNNGLIFSQRVIDEYERLLWWAEFHLECAIAQRDILNERLNACADSGKTADANKQMEKINAGYTHLVFRKDEIEIDHIAILQAATEANRHMSTGQLIREIEEYNGFYFDRQSTSQQSETNLVKEAVIRLKSEEKATRAEQFANVLEVAREKGFDLLATILDGIKEQPDTYPDGTIEGCRAVASLWRVIEKQDGSFDKLLDTMGERGITSKSKADKLAKRMRMALIVGGEEQLAGLASSGHASAKAMQTLAGLLPNREKLTVPKLAEIGEVMAGLDGARMIGRWDSKAKIIKSVRALFECQRTKGEKEKGGKRSNIWRVDGVFDLSSIRKEAEVSQAEKQEVRHQQASMFQQ